MKKLRVYEKVVPHFASERFLFFNSEKFLFMLKNIMIAA
jgi:hypothetical protein